MEGVVSIRKKSIKIAAEQCGNMHVIISIDTFPNEITIEDNKGNSFIYS